MPLLACRLCLNVTRIAPLLTCVAVHRANHFSLEALMAAQLRPRPEALTTINAVQKEDKIGQPQRSQAGQQAIDEAAVQDGSAVAAMWVALLGALAAQGVPISLLNVHDSSQLQVRSIRGTGDKLLSCCCRSRWRQGAAAGTADGAVGADCLRQADQQAWLTSKPLRPLLNPRPALAQPHLPSLARCKLCVR